MNLRKGTNMNEKNLNDNSIDLLQLLKFFISKIWIAIILVILGGMSAFCVAKFKMPLKYQSHISMYVKNSNKTTSANDSVNQGDLNVARSLVSTYIVVLQDDTVMEQVGNELIKKHPLDEISKCFRINYDENGQSSVSVSDIRNSLSMSSVNSTEVLRVTSETKSPEISASVCNIIAEKAQTVLVRVVGAGSVEVIGPAKISNVPSSPNIPKITMMGALVGFVVAFGIVFLIYFFDNTVKSPEEIERRFNKPILGEIQQFSSGNNKKKSSNGNYKLISDKNTSFVMKESYKSMRTNIIFALSASNKKIITVSSANPGEGKSTTASNISLSLAEAGKKVLLIDADLRKPVQHKIFQVNNKLGFSGIIGNINSFEEAVQKNIVENLDLLTSGIKPPNPSELIGSMNTYELLKGLSKIYDYIIIDTPPINVVTDALNISSDIAGMIMILKHASTTTDDIERAVKTVQLANGDLLGMIINDIQHKNDGSYYSKYGNKYYYNSYESTAVKEK